MPWLAADMAIRKSSPLPIHSFVNERVVLSSLQNLTGIVALDEVGRGCLAGPVVTGASLWVPLTFWPDGDPVGLQKLWLPLIRDSKKLTPRAREVCFEGVAQSFSFLREKNASDLIAEALNFPMEFERCQKPERGAIAFDTKGKLGDSVAWTEQGQERLICRATALGAASAAEVDSLNIWGAVQLAMGRALLNLHRSLDDAGRGWMGQAALLVDGNHSIRVPEPFQRLTQLTAVGGDDHFVSVGLSSVVAKVVRDRAMEALDLEHPAYQFAKHKGYATAVHRAAIAQHGPSVHHRLSFLGGLSPES